ncbi:glycine--tRNA ligase [Candidatus Woesearchaeota archaeon]|nr:glycine--tRNA ligase [Candidatus Woesearchaeota archaeon]
MTHTFKDLATFLKKKGFIYPSSEIYGGLAGLYDYGHLGTLLKHNFENVWRAYFLNLNDNSFELETAQIMHHNVFRASGHLANFADPVVKCSVCEFTERADHFVEKATKQRTEGFNPDQLNQLIEKHKLNCPQCKKTLAPVASMNMMFPLHMGVGNTTTAYLRPETAQSPYVNFKLQYELQRKKLPLGLALIGKAFRNEISPRNLTLRQREFTQAELQLFFNPHLVDEHPEFDKVKKYKLRVLLEEDRKKNAVVERTPEELRQKGLPKFYLYHLVKIQQFYFDVIGIPQERFRLYQLDDSEKAFYNKYHFDLEIDLHEHGWTEVGGLHYRTDHDLGGHEKVSKQSMEIFDEESSKRFIPHVLELSFGVDRNVYSLLDLNYHDDKERGNIVLSLPSNVTPFVAGIFPLLKNKEELVKLATDIFSTLRPHIKCFYDEAASIGRRYARADEMGVKYGITIDFDSLNDNCVTVRNRDTTQQERVPITKLREYLI